MKKIRSGLLTTLQLISLVNDHLWPTCSHMCPKIFIKEFLSVTVIITITVIIMLMSIPTVVISMRIFSKIQGTDNDKYICQLHSQSKSTCIQNYITKPNACIYVFLVSMICWEINRASWKMQCV